MLVLRSPPPAVSKAEQKPSSYTEVVGFWYSFNELYTEKLFVTDEI
jgi:hypothetical protein